MTNSDPDSDSGLPLPNQTEESPPAENGVPFGAFGGARPKTKAAGCRSTVVRTRTNRNCCRELDDDGQCFSPTTSSRRRRKVHRTNSSDSVFMIPGSGDNHKSKRGAIQTERNSYEEWTETLNNNFENSDTDLQFYGRLTERVPPLPDNLISSSEGKVMTPNASNSTLSLAEYRSEDPSDLDVLEDDCYIYTYRGGTAYLSADLPNSFFRLDSGSDGESLPGVSGPGQSNLSTGVTALLKEQLLSGQNRSPSPDEPDFLELDFDPGSDKSDLSSEDSGQGRDDEDIVNNSVEASDSDVNNMVGGASALLPERPLLPPQELVIEARRSTSRQASECSYREGSQSVSPESLLQVTSNNLNHPSDVNQVLMPILPAEMLPSNEVDQSDLNSCDREGPSDRESSDSFAEDRSKPLAEVTARSVPLVSPVTESPVINIPRSKSLNNSISCQTADNAALDENVLLCGNRLLLREALIFGRGSVDLHEAVSRLTLCNNSVDVPRSMIWSHRDACRKHVTQLGTHNSSMAAICNALTALNVNISEQDIGRSTKIKVKREKSGLCDYLLSCSESGLNHTDFISEIENVCGDRVVARFFSMHNRVFNLNEWLADWISRGCVPVATLNLQKGDVKSTACPSEAWVNRMIWGVSGKDVFLTNPLEVQKDSCVVAQLDCASELLITRDQIVQHFTPNTDLRCIISNMRGFNNRWKEMNVLGQIVNMLRENTLTLDQDMDATSITNTVHIPCHFVSGVTILCDSFDGETAALLLATAELPTRLMVQHSA